MDNHTPIPEPSAESRPHQGNPEGGLPQKGEPDTICAPATATGGALVLIRVSGQQAFAAVSALCSVCCDRVATHTAHYTHISDGSETIDEAVVTIFRAPHSYTGEDSVEISCHGSRYIANRILELLTRHGCRMARPGEFSMRAFLNGKMDLSQAEAVADLISANNHATHQMALAQLRGHFSSELSQLRQQLLELTSLLELELDFSDHEDLQFADRTQLLHLAQTIDAHITRLAASFKTGQALKQGIPVAIVGKTNVGKSTLLNRLLHDDRAIVSDIHGTTRDTIEDTIDLQGVTFRFIDTAGLRQTNDTVEQIGIHRTYQAIDRASIILWLFDAEPSPSDIADITTHTLGKALIPVYTKADILPANAKADGIPPTNAKTGMPPSPLIPFAASLPHPPHIISAKTGLGIEDLETAIYAAADLPDLTEADVIVSNARHHEALLHAHANLLRVLDGLTHEIPGDLIAEDLRQVLSDLADITGNGQIITSQETLNHIFAHHCVGK